MFNNANVMQSIYQKHLGIILDSKITFENHGNIVTTKINDHWTPPYTLKPITKNHLDNDL